MAKEKKDGEEKANGTLESRDLRFPPLPCPFPRPMLSSRIHRGPTRLHLESQLSKIEILADRSDNPYTDTRRQSGGLGHASGIVIGAENGLLELSIGNAAVRAPASR